jgi:uncharacterized protein (DUF983 family)
MAINLKPLKMETSANEVIKMWPAIINAKCPRCRVGKIFPYSIYSMQRARIYKTCSNCGLTYEREPGYFYSAMYVSYSFIIAEMVSTGVAISVLTGSENPWLYILIMMFVVAALSPFNYRYSRVLLLHWVTPGLRYNPNQKGGVQTNESEIV